jgi:hypothetical protein
MFEDKFLIFSKVMPKYSSKFMMILFYPTNQ